MSATSEQIFGGKLDAFVDECARSLSERLSKLLESPVESAPAQGAASGSGIVVTGALAAGETRFEAFFEEAVALALAGALLANEPAGLEEACNAFSSVAGELVEAIGSGEAVATGRRTQSRVEAVRVVDGPPAGKHGRTFSLHAAGTTGSLVLSFARAPQERPPEVLLELELPFALTLGSVELPLGEIQQLDTGAVIPLDRAADGRVSLVVGGRVIARGELVVVDGCFGIKVDSVETAERRLSSLARA